VAVTSTVKPIPLLGLRWGGRTTVVLLAAIPLAIVLALLLVVLRQAFQPADAATSVYSGANFVAVYTDPFVYRAILNTLVFAAVSVVVALVIAVPMAWLVERTDLPGRAVILPSMTIGLLVPGFVTAMGWLLMFHPRIGLMNKWVMALLPVNSPPFNVGTLVGMGIVQGVSLAGLVFIMVAAAFRAMDPSLEESAQIHGLRLHQRLLKVTIPLLWPGILGAAIYAATIGFAAFDVPAIIGLGNNIFTFSTLIYDQARPQNATPNYGIAAATSMMMVGLALALSFAYLRVIHQSSRYAVVTGKGYRPRLFHLGPGAIALAWTFVGVETLFGKVLPVLALFWLSVNPFLRLPSPEAFATLNFAAYQNIGSAKFGNAIWNTAILILVVPTATALFGLLISWVVTRSRIKGVSGAFDVLAFLPHAVPHIVFAVGAIVLTLKYLPDWLPLYGTLFLLIIVYVVTRLSFATRVYNASLLQIHRELDEAGYVFGLRRLTVLWTILRPLLTPALVYTWFWMALLTYRELTIPALLASRDNAVMSTQIWAVWQSEPPAGAALTLAMIGIMLPLMAIYFVLGRRVASGGVGGW